MHAPRSTHRGLRQLGAQMRTRVGKSGPSTDPNGPIVRLARGVSGVCPLGSGPRVGGSNPPRPPFCKKPQENLINTSGDGRRLPAISGGIPGKKTDPIGPTFTEERSYGHTATLVSVHRRAGLVPQRHQLRVGRARLERPARHRPDDTPRERRATARARRHPSSRGLGCPVAISTSTETPAHYVEPLLALIGPLDGLLRCARARASARGHISRHSPPRASCGRTTSTTTCVATTHLDARAPGTPGGPQMFWLHRRSDDERWDWTITESRRSSDALPDRAARDSRRRGTSRSWRA